MLKIEIIRNRPKILPDTFKRNAFVKLKPVNKIKKEKAKR